MYSIWTDGYLSKKDCLCVAPWCSVCYCSRLGSCVFCSKCMLGQLHVKGMCVRVCVCACAIHCCRRLWSCRFCSSTLTPLCNSACVFITPHAHPLCLFCPPPHTSPGAAASTMHPPEHQLLRSSKGAMAARHPLTSIRADAEVDALWGAPSCHPRPPATIAFAVCIKC